MQLPAIRPVPRRTPCPDCGSLTHYRVVVDLGGVPGRRNQQSGTHCTTERAMSERDALLAVKASIPVKARGTRQRLAEAGYLPMRDVIAAGLCTGQCLAALEQTCICRCGGPLHGAGLDALIPVTVETQRQMPDGWRTLAAADVLRFGPAALRVARANLGLRQEDIGPEVGIHPGQLSRLERGLYRPNWGQAVRLLRRLGLGGITIDQAAAILPPVPSTG